MAVNNSAWIEKKRNEKKQRLYNCSLMWLVFVYQMYWCQNGQLWTMVTNCWKCKPKINRRLNKWKKEHVNRMRPNIKKNSTQLNSNNNTQLTKRRGGGFCPQYILTYIRLIYTLHTCYSFGWLEIIVLHCGHKSMERFSLCFAFAEDFRAMIVRFTRLKRMTCIRSHSVE